MEQTIETQVIDTGNLFRLTDHFIENALKQSTAGITKGNCDFVSLHVSLNKSRELIEQLKSKLK